MLRGGHETGGGGHGKGGGEHWKGEHGDAGWGGGREHETGV